MTKNDWIIPIFLVLIVAVAAIGNGCTFGAWWTKYVPLSWECKR